MSEKTPYTAIPFEDSQAPNERELPPYSEKPRYTFPPSSLDSNPHVQRKKTWRKALLFVLLLFLGGRFLLAGISFFMFNDFNPNDDQYIWIQVPGMEPHYEPEIGSHEMPYNAPAKPILNIPESPICESSVKWNGPSELLLDPNDVTGLIFKVKGIAHGSVIIRQDPNSKDFLNITNKIYLSEDTIQEQVDIRIDIIDEDYSITIEAPSFEGPRPTQKCVQVDTIITIPSQVRFFRSLLVDVPNSWISAESLGAIDFAYVSLKTINGHIRADDISAAIAEVSTVNGHVKGGYVIAESFDVRTINGGIGIHTIINPWSDEISITTKSINGHLDVTVHELNEKQALNFKAGSVNGGVVATLKMKKVHKKEKKMMKKTKKGCRHNRHDDEKASQIAIEAVTGSLELYL
ncbi:4504_t:CDS:2 [Funneliformis geosporum]|uniref:4504_t:CDS:1 n=1 Tax=Funneliformis geosporum TaxID=1117311 RepID=A0A9W4SE82_9GLOM|nr:4504_t:CDS:2 [Funneliformis geosporum]